MVALPDEDAVVIESLRHEFEEMGDFSPEGLDGKITVDPADVCEEATDGDWSPSIFYWSVHGEFMDWGFRLSCAFREAFPPEADPVATEFTPYATLILKRLVQTWAEVGLNSTRPRQTRDGSPGISYGYYCCQTSPRIICGIA